MTITTTEIHLTPEVGVVVDFDRAIERFKRAVLDGDTEFVVAMTALVENMIGDES